MYERYPWHKSIWRQLLERVNSATLPHALLLSGSNGIGKRDFAIQFSQLMLCETFRNNPMDGDAVPCGRCQACTLNKVSTHPDFKLVEPESEGKVITIDQIRELSEYLGLKSHYDRGQVVVICPAEKMNKFAANSLLKTLEEPSPSSLILLVTSQPSALLPTIRSRCQQLTFQQPALDTALPWLKTRASKAEDDEITAMLQLANGGPLEALAYLKNNTQALIKGIWDSFVNLSMGQADPVSVAKVWADTEVQQLVKWLILWTSHMIKLKYAVGQPDNILTDQGELKKLAAGVDLSALFRFFDKLTETRRLLDSQANIQLLLEDLLIVWWQLNVGQNHVGQNRR